MSDTGYVAELGDDVYTVVDWLADAGGLALYGAPGALLIGPDGRLVDSRQLAAERHTPAVFKRAE